MTSNKKRATAGRGYLVKVWFVLFFKIKDARACFYIDRNDLERKKMIQKKENSCCRSEVLEKTRGVGI